MNDARRKELDRAIAAIEEAITIVEIVRGEEEEALENLPEGLQSSERGEQMQSAIDTLEQAEESARVAIDELIEAKGGS